ncbi:MAG: polysaccharide deacetylase family protein [Ignavibacteriales bacterium]|nr:polysaccharide deacetylase family protein [Ignavibacteriales bacterium]
MVTKNGGKPRRQSLVVLLMLMTLTCIGSVGFSQSIDSPYEVATWQGFRSAAVSFTFDDGTPNQSTVAVPMFNEYGFKATFFTVINWGPNWTALQSAANSGHEIASHTMSHASLGSISTDQYAELRNSQDAINARIAGQKCLTIAYPNCVVGDKALCSQFYIAARICSGQIEPSTPADFMAISSFVCGTQGSIQRSEDFSNKVAAAVRTKGWVVFLIHAIDGESGYSPTSSTQLRGALDSLKSHIDTYWVSSFVNVARYVKERNNVSVKEIAASDSTLTMRVTDTLPDSIYNYPVTIRRPLPSNWSSVTLTQSGKNISGQVVVENGTKYLMFDVVPDNGDIALRKSTATAIGSSFNTVPSRTMLMPNYPNPFNPSTSLEFQVSSSAFVSLKVLDVLGREVATLVKEERQPGTYTVRWDGSGFPSGVYFCRLHTGSGTETKRLALVR